MLRAFAVLLALAAPPALALDLPPKAEPVLARGKPYVEVRPDADGSSGVILGAIDVPAPIEAVWAVITDCDLAPKMVASLKSCRVVERDPAGRWEVREQVSKGGLIPSVRSVFRSDFEKP